METSKTRELSNFHYISLTDAGRRRPSNEDSSGYFDTPNGHIFVVCDGCGGMPCGEKASQGVVNSMKFFFNSFYYKDPQEAIRDAIKYAHNFLISEGEKDLECMGMGTTVALALIRYNKVYYGHVGDSRIYLLSGREFRQLTKDDSYVQHLVDQGEITPEQAETHPRKNELMQVMGQLDAPPEPHVCKQPIMPCNGDLLMLCSDGLFNMVPAASLRAVLSKKGYIEEKGAQLVKAALANGGYDNITLQIIKFFNVEATSESASASPAEKPDAMEQDRNRRAPLAAAMLAIVAVVLGVMLYLRESRRHEQPAPDSAQPAEIAAKFDMDTIQDPDFLIKAFGIPKSKVTYTEDNGRRLMRIPVKAIISARYYDNLSTLEMLHGVPKEKIARANGLADGQVQTARKIIIPL